MPVGVRKVSRFFYIRYCLITGWLGIKTSFTIWLDLLRGDYKNYALLDEDCPYTECRSWFWYSLAEDNVYPKEFLEKLLTLVDAVESGEEDLVEYPFSEWE